MLGDAPQILRLERPHRAFGEPGEHRPQLLRQRNERANLLADLPCSRNVHGIRDELPAERQPHHLRDRRAGLVLCLLRGGAQMRGDHDVIEVEERMRGRRRLGNEDVKSGSTEPALPEG